MSLDRTTHSLFGVSKAAADLLVQEYGRYFDMPTVSLRCGCITGPSHAGAVLHGFLAYLMKCHRHRHALHRLRLRRQAGPRQHPRRRRRERMPRVPRRSARGRRLQPRRRARLELLDARGDRGLRAHLGARARLVAFRPRPGSATTAGGSATSASSAATIRTGDWSTTSRRCCARSTTPTPRPGAPSRHEALGGDPGPQRGRVDRANGQRDHRNAPARGHRLRGGRDRRREHRRDRGRRRAAERRRRARPLPPLPLRPGLRPRRARGAGAVRRAMPSRS